jgi:hypothetical protein
VAAAIFIALSIFAAAFQVALVAGMPWGALTWGGRFRGRLPDRMRAVAAVSAVLLLAFALVVAIRAGMFQPDWQPLSRTLVWGVVAYTALGVVANAITPSRWERIVWLPIVLMMLVCSILVATS